MDMIHISQSALASLSLYSAAVGAALGAVYDVFRIMRIAAEPTCRLKKEKGVRDAASRTAIRGEKIRFFVVFVEDILFSVISAAVISITVFHLDSGHPRWFILLGAAAGFAVYYHTVGRLTSVCAPYIILFVRTVIYFAMRITIIPVARLVRRIYRCLSERAAERCRRHRSNLMKTQILGDARSGFGFADVLRDRV